MTFYSGLDKNLDMNEKILASTFQNRPRTALENNSAALDMSRAAGASYDNITEDWWGIPRINIANQVKNIRRAGDQQQRIIDSPWINYTGETVSAFGAGPWRGGGYMDPPQAGGYMAPPQAGGYMSPPQAGGYLAPPQTMIGGSWLKDMSKSVLAPLIISGVQHLSSKIINKAKKYAEGSGMAYPLSSSERKYISRPEVILSRDIPGLYQADKDVLNSHSSGEFWNKVINHGAGMITERIGDGISGGGKKYNAKYRQGVHDVARNLIEGQFVGGGMMSPLIFKKIMNNKYDEPEDRVERLTIGHVARPIIETAVEKGPIGRGMNADEKQATLDLISEVGGPDLAEEVSNESIGGGSFFSGIKNRLKNVFRKASQSDLVRNMAGKVREHIAEQLPKRLAEYAEVGVEKALGALPEGRVKNITQAHKDTIKKVARNSTEKLTKHLGEKAGAHIKALADSATEPISTGSGYYKARRGRGANRVSPYEKKNWAIRL